MKPSATRPGTQPPSLQHQSPWIEAEPKPNPYQPLKENLVTDVVIIGGGLAGVTTAYCLTQSGKKVVLVEDGTIGSGETSHTTAHLVTALDDRYTHFEKLFGEEDTLLIAQSHKAAIDFVEQTIQQEKIDCHFERVSGHLFRHPSDREDILKEELNAAQKAGIHPIYLNQIPGMLNTDEACLEFPHQAQFHPLLYLHGLCKAIVENGGQLYTNTHAAIINADGIITADGFNRES
jgi:glycine/D-amino acid oxidase-like deaminating enzyme